MRYKKIQGELEGGGVFELNDGALTIRLEKQDMMSANKILRAVELELGGAQAKPEQHKDVQAAAATTKAAPAAEKPAAEKPAAEKPAATVTPIRKPAEAAKSKEAEKPVEKVAEKDPNDDIPFAKDEEETGDVEVGGTGEETDGNESWGMGEKPVAPEELKKATKLRDVVVYLQDRMGCDTEQKIVEACVKYTDQVPVLERLTGDINERVKRVLATLG